MTSTTAALRSLDTLWTLWTLQVQLLRGSTVYHFWCVLPCPPLQSALQTLNYRYPLVASRKSLVKLVACTSSAPRHLINRV